MPFAEAFWVVNNEGLGSIKREVYFRFISISLHITPLSLYKQGKFFYSYIAPRICPSIVSPSRLSTTYLVLWGRKPMCSFIPTKLTTNSNLVSTSVVIKKKILLKLHFTEHIWLFAKCLNRLLLIMDKQSCLHKT